MGSAVFRRRRPWSWSGSKAKGWTPASPPQPLAVEVAFYELEGGWVQARWNLRLEQGAACPNWAVELFENLSRLLRQEPLWQIDGP